MSSFFVILFSAEVVDCVLEERLLQLLVYVLEDVALVTFAVAHLAENLAARVQDALDGVATSKIVRIHVLSFAILRSFRFGGSHESDVAIRALIAAALLRAMAGSNAELNLRANCILDEDSEPATELDERFGKKEELEPLTVESSEDLLQQAYEQAHRIAGIEWDGQAFQVQGNSTLFASGSDEVAGE